jgi:hypothetical protein
MMNEELFLKFCARVHEDYEKFEKQTLDFPDDKSFFKSGRKYIYYNCREIAMALDIVTVIEQMEYDYDMEADYENFSHMDNLDYVNYTDEQFEFMLDTDNFRNLLEWFIEIMEDGEEEFAINYNNVQEFMWKELPEILNEELK